MDLCCSPVEVEVKAELAEPEPSECLWGLSLWEIAASAKVVEGSGVGSVRWLRHCCLKRSAS